MAGLYATPNLPSRDLDATAAFYGRLGFAPAWRDADWMILERGDAVIEFFPHPGLDPAESWFSCCLRTDDLDGLAGELAALDLPAEGIPRLHPGIRRITEDLRMVALVDPDGSLIRCLGP